MGRAVTRGLNRIVMSAIARDACAAARRDAATAALTLLERSVAFGHTRLAIRRLSHAVELEADVSPAQWRYCQELAAASADDKIRSQFLSAATRWNSRRLKPVRADATPQTAGNGAEET